MKCVECCKYMTDGCSYGGESPTGRACVDGIGQGMTRNEMICADRASGMTLKAIGTKYGISKEGVRQVCLRKEREEKRLLELFASDFLKYNDPPNSYVGTRIINSFKRTGFKSKEEVIESVMSGDIRKVRNLGRIYIHIICEEYGIPFPDYLLKEESDAE